MAKIKVTQKKSVISSPAIQGRTIKALGLKRINHTVIHEDRPEIRGMINKVRHLVEAEDIK